MHVCILENRRCTLSESAVYLGFRFGCGQSGVQVPDGPVRKDLDMSKRALQWLGMAVVLMAAWSSPAVSVAREREDHERARQAVESGQILPLKAILARVEREAPGEVLEVELEQQDSGVWVYELKVLQRGGVLTKLKLDARTGAVLKSRGQRAGTRERGRDRERDRERD
jgi:Peptidase propeptide and YPEB domain